MNAITVYAPGLVGEVRPSNEMVQWAISYLVPSNVEFDVPVNPSPELVEIALLHAVYFASQRAGASFAVESDRKDAVARKFRDLCSGRVPARGSAKAPPHALDQYLEQLVVVLGLKAGKAKVSLGGAKSALGKVALWERATGQKADLDALLQTCKLVKDLT